VLVRDKFHGRALTPAEAAELDAYVDQNPGRATVWRRQLTRARNAARASAGTQ